jgi:hypothetical protein
MAAHQSSDRVFLSELDGPGQNGNTGCRGAQQGSGVGDKGGSCCGMSHMRRYLVQLLQFHVKVFDGMKSKPRQGD